MDIKAKTCQKCGGTGHDKGGMPVVKMVDFDSKQGHRKYTDEAEQKRFHQTIKRGSGCLSCGGVGFISLEVE